MCHSRLYKGSAYFKSNIWDKRIGKYWKEKEKQKHNLLKQILFITVKKDSLAIDFSGNV